MLDEKEKQQIIRNLTALGLSERDAMVYLSLITQGEVGSSKIISQTGLHGQYVYNSLANLEEKGLVQHIIKNGRKKFSAKNPSILINLVDIQQRIAQETSARLAQIAVMPKDQKSETFQGNESYVAHEFDLLQNALNDCQLLIIGGKGDRFAKEMAENLKRYEKIRIEKNITVRYIGSQEQKQELEELIKSKKNFDYKILPGLFTGLVNTNIWPEAISLNIFGSPVTTFTLSNKEIAQSYALFFETLWNIATE